MVSCGNDDVRGGSQNVNTMLWVAQSLLAVLFLFSGVMKSTQSEQKLVASGQTGVEGLPRPLIRFIGISEILGAVGLVLPMLSNVMPGLTPLGRNRAWSNHDIGGNRALQKGREEDSSPEPVHTTRLPLRCLR